MGIREKKEELLIAYEELVSTVDKHFKQEYVTDSDIKRRFIARLVFKATKTGRAVLILCKKGFGQDALSLARSLFETAVNAGALLILSESEGINRFEQYKTVILYDRLLRSKQAGLKSGPLIQNEETIKRNFEKYGRQFKKRTWSKQSVSQLSSKVLNSMDESSPERVKFQFKQLLNLGYDAGSDFIHGNVWSILFYSDNPKDRAFRIAPADEYVAKAIGQAWWGMLVALHTLNATFEVGEDGTSLEYARRWNEILTPLPKGR